MEAGNRCFDECLPEETNRRIVDVTSDVNLCYSEHARRYLNAAGVPKDRTFVVGSPMAEVLHQNLPQIEVSDIHARLGLEKGKYILLSTHREENIDTEENFRSLFTAVNAMAAQYDLPVLYSCHPRSRKRLEESSFRLDKPFPAVCIRTSTERPEALDKGCFVLSGIHTEQLLQSIDLAVQMQQNGEFGTPVPDYTTENVSVKVARIIQSYTGIVDRFIWRK